MENKETTKNIDTIVCQKPSKKIHGGILALVGYILSPLSWWNDPIVNIPLAYFFALPFGLISKNLFTPMIITGYLGTNVLGLFLLHHGTIKITGANDRACPKKQLLKHMIIALAYTVFVVILIKRKLLRLPDINYFLK